MLRFALFAALIGCGHDSQTTQIDAGPTIDAAPDAAPVAPPPACPTTGKGAIAMTTGTCAAFPPTTAGALASGANANEDDYALAPAAGNGHLVVFLNPSLGSPATSIADPATNVYTAGVAAGDHVLAISYASDQVLGISCQNNDACYIASRMAVLTGVPTTGAASSLATIDLTTGIYSRTALALQYLVASQPGLGWDQFVDPAVDPKLDPAGYVRWSKVISVGHSQGGGHAELIAREQIVARVVTLSSPCDEVNNQPASWLHPDAMWKTSVAAVGYGFSSQGDTICVDHAAIWDALGYVASHRHEDAAQCTGASTHTATIQCTANMARVQDLLSL